MRVRYWAIRPCARLPRLPEYLRSLLVDLGLRNLVRRMPMTAHGATNNFTLQVLRSESYDPLLTHHCPPPPPLLDREKALRGRSSNRRGTLNCSDRGLPRITGRGLL